MALQPTSACPTSSWGTTSLTSVQSVKPTLTLSSTTSQLGWGRDAGTSSNICFRYRRKTAREFSHLQITRISYPSDITTSRKWMVGKTTSWKKLDQGFSWDFTRSNLELWKMRTLQTLSGHWGHTWILPRKDYFSPTKTAGSWKINLENEINFFTRILSFIDGGDGEVQWGLVVNICSEISANYDD